MMCRALHLLPLLLTLALGGCATYEDRVAPVPMPAQQEDAVVLEGATLFARGYADPEAAREAFGFDIRGAGLLPVQFVIDNQSERRVAIMAGETLLIDRVGQGWPLLAADRAAERVSGSVAQGEAVRSGARASLLAGLAGAVAGAAVGIVTGEDVANTTGKGAAAGAAIGAIAGGGSRYANVGRDIQEDIQRESIQDRLIGPGELAYGFLFFPGRDEASSARSLRLGLRFGEETRNITLPVREVLPANRNE